MTDAPVCPISSGTLPYRRRLHRASGQLQGGETKFPGISSAHDLPSLIRTTNLLRETLRSLVVNKVVNNLYLPRPPNHSSKGNTTYSQFPQWSQVSKDTERGMVYHKAGKDQVDKSQRAEVERIHRVEFQNAMQEDPEFKWSYKKEIK